MAGVSRGFHAGRRRGLRPAVPSLLPIQIRRLVVVTRRSRRLQADSPSPSYSRHCRPEPHPTWRRAALVHRAAPQRPASDIPFAGVKPAPAEPAAPTWRVSSWYNATRKSSRLVFSERGQPDALFSFTSINQLNGGQEWPLYQLRPARPETASRQTSFRETAGKLSAAQSTDGRQIPACCRSQCATRLGNFYTRRWQATRVRTSGSADA